VVRAAPDTEKEKTSSQQNKAIMRCYAEIVNQIDCRMAEASAATETAMRPEILQEYAAEVRCHDLEMPPIENDFWRFYRLTP
jgi:hypothetical protein